MWEGGKAGISTKIFNIGCLQACVIVNAYLTASDGTNNHKWLKALDDRFGKGVSGDSRNKSSLQAKKRMKNSFLAVRNGLTIRVELIIITTLG